MRAEGLRRVLLLALCCLVLAVDADAQGYKRKKKKNKAKPPAATAPKNAGKEEPPLELPPWLAPPKKGDEKAKAGAKAKAAPDKPAAPAPADPMKQADLVTKSADERARFEEEQAATLRGHFALCDLDGNGWISLREGALTLALSREEYQRADTSKDGRIDADEFVGQKQLVLTRLGARAPARAPGETPAADAAPAGVSASATSEPAPAAADEQPSSAALAAPAPAPVALEENALLLRSDADGSHGLDASELAQFLSASGLSLSAELLVEQLDPDGSGQLEAGELDPILWLSAKNGVVFADTRAGADVAAAPSVAPAPASSAAHSTHFSRLDAGHDGYVDADDLRQLQSPARLDLRLKAVLSAMDRDGDGRLSEAEFRRSMERAPR